MLSKARAISIPFVFAIDFKSDKRDNYSYCDSWKSDNYTGSNTEKKLRTKIQIRNSKWSKEVKSNKFCYRNVGRVITIWGAIENSQLLILQYWKKSQFNRATKIILLFLCTNNIFLYYRVRPSMCIVQLTYMYIRHDQYWQIA